MTDRESLNKIQKAFYDGYHKGYSKAEKKWTEILASVLNDKIFQTINSGKKTGQDILTDFVKNSINLDYLNQLDNNKFSDVLLEDYWANIDIDNPLSTVLSMTIERLRGEFVQIQPCGHPVSAIVQADEGTAYCGACEREARE